MNLLKEDLNVVVMNDDLGDKTMTIHTFVYPYTIACYSLALRKGKIIRVAPPVQFGQISKNLS